MTFQPKDRVVVQTPYGEREGYVSGVAHSRPDKLYDVRVDLRTVSYLTEDKLKRAEGV